MTHFSSQNQTTNPNSLRGYTYSIFGGFFYVIIFLFIIMPASAIDYKVEVGTGIDNLMVWQPFTGEIAITEGDITEVHQYFAIKSMHHWAFMTLDEKRADFAIDFTETDAKRYRVRIRAEMEGNVGEWVVSDPVYITENSVITSLRHIYDSVMGK